MDVIELLERMKGNIEDDMGYPGMVLVEVLTKTIEDYMRDRVVKG